MGNSNNKNTNNDDSNVVIKDAPKLKRFFAEYYDTPEKQELLAYVPIGTNYTIWNKTAMPIETIFGPSPFAWSSNPLSFQLNSWLGFCGICQIKISKEYDQKLIDFSKKTKTNAQIVREYYQNNQTTNPS